MVKLSLAVFLAALLSVAVAGAVPSDSREARIIKVRALRDAAEQANLTKRQGNSAFGRSQGNGRAKGKGKGKGNNGKGHGHGNGPDLDFDPKNCGRPFFECPASYNGVGTPHCDYGHCKLRCPPGWNQFLSHHPELPNFCAPA
ncbi:hypothetical protein JCM3775_003257 [Rhodotorula graminis]